MHLADIALDLAKSLAGNHRKFTSFGWHDRPDDSDKWAIVYTSNRDSGIVEQSNAAVIERALSKPEFEDDIRFESHGHWAVGHVDGFSIRCFDGAGNVTPVLLAYAELHAALESYPVLDDDDVSMREFDAACTAIGQIGRSMVIDGAPEGWAGEVARWLYDNDSAEMENTDGTGAYPSDDSVRAALEALGWLDSDDSE